MDHSTQEHACQFLTRLFSDACIKWSSMLVHQNVGKVKCELILKTPSEDVSVMAEFINNNDTGF